VLLSFSRSHDHPYPKSLSQTMTVDAHREARREDPIHQEQWLQRQYDSASTSESTRIDDDPAVHRGNLYTELLH
jgi:hypothetical protein